MKNVYYEKARKRYRGMVSVAGVNYRVGRFRTEEEAGEAVRLFTEKKTAEVTAEIDAITLPGEVWIDIPGLDGKYKVSSFGRVKSYTKKRGIINLIKDKNGYFRFGVRTTSKSPKAYFVHLAVMSAFTGHVANEVRRLVVDHIDGDKANNRLDNLQVVSRQVNSLKGVHKGILPYVYRDRDGYRGSFKIGTTTYNVSKNVCEMKVAKAVIEKYKIVAPENTDIIEYLEKSLVEYEKNILSME